MFDFLDVMSNHAPFTDHMLDQWEYSGPSRGVGAKAKVVATLAGRREPIDMQVIAAERPRTIVEQNVGAGGRRVATGTYRLDPLANGGTRITFEYAWKQAPVSERLAAPLVRKMLASANRRALVRLAEQLDDVFPGVH